MKYFKALTGKELTPEVIAVIHTFGEGINFHPHLHVLITEGGADKEGNFHKVSNFDYSLIAEIFTQEVFSLLLKEKLISLELVRKILLCPKCHGQMKVIAFITDYSVVEKIINHLKLCFVAERPPPQPSQQLLYEATGLRSEYLS